MTPAKTFSGRRVALFGLGGSGLATARALVTGGADVLCWDDGAAGREKAQAAGLAVSDLAQAEWSGFDTFVLSPGVPLTHPKPHWTVERAKAAGVEIIGDIEIFCRERAKLAPDAPFVAITGTNGKSTTTALIAHLFAAFGGDVQMGGNIGVPVLDLAPPSNARVHVLELSTFQIDLTPSLHPSIGVLLNLTPDHLDRHGTMENYAAIKERLVAASDRAIVATDDGFTQAIVARLRDAGRAVTTVSARDEATTADLRAEGTKLLKGDEALADLAGIGTLRGRHNAQNALCAVAALLAVDPQRDPVTLQRALASFDGLPHRTEEVARDGRTIFVNDSKATNADATEKALGAFDTIFWILGGRAKAEGIAPLAPFFPRIAKAYLIGESSDAFAKTLGAAVSHEFCGTLDVAVARAAADASRSEAREPVVLLSPACASYDQFPNYEVRGDRFRTLVKSLTTHSGAAA